MSISRIKKVIRNTNFADVKAMVEQALALPTAAEIEAHVEKFIVEKTICSYSCR
jgi:phosphotransferase system enzyme I (PtsI)